MDSKQIMSAFRFRMCKLPSSSFFFSAPCLLSLGFSFVVGYCLDFNEVFRDLPHLAIISEVSIHCHEFVLFISFPHCRLDLKNFRILNISTENTLYNVKSKLKLTANCFDRLRVLNLCYLLPSQSRGSSH